MTAELKPGDYVLVNGWKGVAYYIVGPEMENELFEDEETGEQYWTGDKVETGRWRVCMVGDDRVEVHDPDDLTPINEDAFCHECGQIGCTHDGRDRD